MSYFFAGTAVASSLYGMFSGASASKKAAKAQADAMRKQTMFNTNQAYQAEKQTDFERAQWEEQMEEVAKLEEMFGPIRENLSKYYSAMTPEQFKLRGKEAIEREYERSDQAIDAVFSNNGMYNSGQRADAQVALESAREQAMGESMVAGESQYQQEQQNWLTSGLNEKTNAQNLADRQQGRYSNAMTNQMNVAQAGNTSMQNMYNNQINQYNSDATAAGQMVSGGLKTAAYMYGKQAPGNPPADSGFTTPKIDSALPTTVTPAGGTQSYNMMTPPWDK